MDGNVHPLIPSSRERAALAEVLTVGDVRAILAPVPAASREPAPAFEVNRRAGYVEWTLTGLRLREPDDFRQLSNLFLTNGWPRNYNRLLDAEMELTALPPGEAA